MREAFEHRRSVLSILDDIVETLLRASYSRQPLLLVLVLSFWLLCFLLLESQLDQFMHLLQLVLASALYALSAEFREILGFDWLRWDVLRLRHKLEKLLSIA